MQGGPFLISLIDRVLQAVKAGVRPRIATRDGDSAAERRLHQKDKWQRNWKLDDYSPPWLGQEISPELVAAAEEGWSPAGAPALDIRCVS